LRISALRLLLHATQMNLTGPIFRNSLVVQ